MAKNDDFDSVLNDKRLNRSDWEGLAKVLRVGKKMPKDLRERREFINREFRHSYGHTFANVFRDSWEPDYEEIVRATAKKLKQQVRSHHTVEDLEQKIIVEVIDRAREQIIKEKGPAAWEKIELDIENEVDRLIAEAKLPPGVLESLKKSRAAGFGAALVAGRFAGFTLYIVANQTFFAIARSLGLKIGVAVAGPIIGKTLALILGPAGWILAGLWLAYDLGNTSWKKVVPAVVIAASLRARFALEDQEL